MKRILTTLAVVAAALGGLAASAHADTLDTVKQRGQLICGSNTGLPGFGIPDDKGNWTGLDVDFCRAVAVAIFNDPTKVKFVPLNAKDRFTALQAGEVDVLARNGTWTLTRESTLALLFAGPNYYDGQGFLVRKKLNVSSALELNGASICVQQGTTTELNLADYFRAHNMKFEPVVFTEMTEVIKAYDSGRCDALTDDSSGLAAYRLKMTNPDEHVLLPEIISKEPLAPAVRQGDDKWFNIIRWVGYAMIQAEEFGITSQNVDDMMKSDNPDIKRFLGLDGDLGKSLGLNNDWAYQIVKKVGNYGEVFEKNLGDGTPLKLKRGLNQLWTKGGLQYAPPLR
ncbi:amino acid ABC transporter substrate-binding protein [Methylovirgula sp. 4M-Z18]|uniref:amino acid ABC transporter substrate-binding protein n=1 Tax=Methylovirgula sp. 4M-Z18 TaxID=2293567 RepID=UPI000E2ECA4C|nr:amino acid ABC transporter substrate-binding protein [Methylovirgula sp. 4M-Z18]RFB80312.1 amino acid ABC transporter substrate-binding protein [Methylovirgula sp. 4M-Z18]